MSAFGTYLIGFGVVIVGLSFAAYLLNVPPLWIAAGALVIAGIGVNHGHLPRQGAHRDPRPCPPSRYDHSPVVDTVVRNAVPDES